MFDVYAYFIHEEHGDELPLCSFELEFDAVAFLDVIELDYEISYIEGRE